MLPLLNATVEQTVAPFPLRALYLNPSYLNPLHHSLPRLLDPHRRKQKTNGGRYEAGMSEVGARHLADALLRRPSSLKLEHLNLYGNHVGDDGAAALARAIAENAAATVREGPAIPYFFFQPWRKKRRRRLQRWLRRRRRRRRCRCQEREARVRSGMHAQERGVCFWL